MSRWRLRQGCGCLLLVILGGCGGSTDSSAPEGDPLGEATPLTEDEAKKFAASLEAAAAAQTPAPLQALFDFDALLTIASAGLEPDSRFEQGFRRGFKDSQGKPGGLPIEIQGAVARGGSYKFRRYHRDGEEDRLMFRLVLPDSGGVNYQDLIIRRRSDGSIKIVDLYAFLSAEKVSKTVRRLLVPLLARQNRGALARLAGPDQVLVAYETQVERFGQAARAGDPNEALEIFEQLPEELRKEKAFQIMRLMAAQRTGNENTYLQALEGLRQGAKADGSVDLLSIDYYFLRKRFDRAREAIDRVEQAVGADAYLDVLRGNAFMEEGKLAEAQQRFDKALAAEPTLLEAHRGLVGVALKQKRFDDVLARLKAMHGQFTIAWADFTQEPDYAEFVRTPQYQQWLKHLGQR